MFESGSARLFTLFLPIWTFAVSVVGCDLTTREETFHVDVSEGSTEHSMIDRLVVEAGSGNIEVRASEREEEIIVDVTIHGEETTISRERRGTELFLSTNCNGSHWNCGVDYRITAPARVDVELHTGSGDIELDGMAGDALLDTGSGDVETRCFTGRLLEADTGSGDIRATGLRAADVRGDTGSGDIDLSFAG